MTTRITTTDGNRSNSQPKFSNEMRQNTRTGKLPVKLTGSRPTPWFKSLPKKAQKALQDAGQRLQLGGSACVLWDRLSKVQQKEIGSLDSAMKRFGGVVGIWRKLFGGSQPRAVVEAAYFLGHLDQGSREWLLREIGDPLPTPKSVATRPNWDGDRGELRFAGKLARRIRVMKYPPNIHQILDAFEAAQWPTSVQNPLTLGQEQLHQALRSLNKGLNGLRFHARQGASVVYWEPT